ncbi:MAG: ATP-binding protein [Streptococcaceae bacterium]|jgi:predicted AAA+ superfamily ATPase|nr:ATP-binding protein [Streptococcaceae bacterium]
MIQRKNYLDWLIKNKNNGLIKVISGVRRSGKSTLFELYKQHLFSLGVKKEQIIHLNFEDLRYFELRDFLILNKFILEQITTNEVYYIFLDEIQHVSKFEEVVNSLNLQENLDIYLTGSNAYFMSGDLATLLTGRYVELEILPLSFKEYQSQFPNISLADVYDIYKKTSFPYLVKVEDAIIINDYIRGAYNDIAIKDIVTRYKITEQDILERTLRFLVSAVGSEISINKVTNTLKSQGVTISNNTVERFIDALVNGLILYKAPRYDIKGRELLSRFEKYYVVDLGFRRLLVPDAKEDEGHILENIVYFELKRRYSQVYIGRSGKYEVDFVCLDAHANPSYYQVALQTLDEKVLKRELHSLELIEDSYPKYLLTLDFINKEANFGGILKMNALDWLMNT